jgi:hypothetical protein
MHQTIFMIFKNTPIMYVNNNHLNSKTIFYKKNIIKKNQNG